jgi:putative ABC transport system permease protein
MAMKSTGQEKMRERNILIGLQICFSFVLLVFSFIVTDQIKFFKTKGLGFEKENILVIDLNPDFFQHQEAFKEELKKSQFVIDVTGGTAPGDSHNGWRFIPEDGQEEKP